eukprot:snap_masked-scaffold_7-processed-gene-7.11-mRNA-1 protein AED:0.65 eAED:0.65 QI:0/-1/0/1/-1/1/1/0/79
MKSFDEVTESTDQKPERRIRKTEEIMRYIEKQGLKEREKRSLIRKIEKGSVRVFQNKTTLEVEFRKVEPKIDKMELTSE